MNGWLDGTPFGAIENAVEAALVAGTLLPLLGMWVVLQRVVFLGVTLAQIAAAGVALALVLDVPALPVGLATTLAVVIVTAAAGKGRVATLGDSALGAAFCAASALALLFVQRSPADLDEVQHVLHGNLIWASDGAVAAVTGVLVAGLIVIGLFFKELLFATFDGETARALGLATKGWLLLLFSVLAVVLSVSMRTTGSLLTFAMLVLPPLAALQLGRGLLASFGLAAALGFVGTVGGLSLAVSADLHVESSITMALFALLPVCAGWRRHPIAGIGALAVTLALGVAMAVTQPGFDAPPHHHHDDIELTSEPYHVDVILSARQLDERTLQVEWDLDVHRVDVHAELPASVWIVLTGDDLMHEHVLLDESHVLPAGHTLQHGACTLAVEGPIHRIEGQLWTGPPSRFDPPAEPLPATAGDVVGTDVVRGGS